MKPGDGTKGHGLRLIRGGLDREHSESDLPCVVVAREEHPPFAVDALVMEDDTYCVLSASPDLQEAAEPSLRLWNELHETEPAAPGDAIFRGGTPPQISAVVHDLSRDPTWTEQWVALALVSSLRRAEEHEFHSLGLQPLGCIHGRLAPECFPPLLRVALDVAELRSLQRIWLIGDPGLFDLTPMGDGTRSEPGP